jgi:predicted type IV restriction endonuclease
MSSRQNEAFSRILIDKALEFSGWDLLNPRQVQFELHSTTGVQITRYGLVDPAISARGPRAPAYPPFLYQHQ